MEADIHAGNRGVVEPFEQIVEEHCFVSGFLEGLDGLEGLGQDLIHVNGGDVVVLESDDYGVFLG